jgi:hypothetical protein
MRYKPTLSSRQLQQLTAMCVQLKTHYDTAVDIEFATSSSGKVWLLQVHICTLVELHALSLTLLLLLAAGHACCCSLLLVMLAAACYCLCLLLLLLAAAPACCCSCLLLLVLAAARACR